jgi:hypothetical protein
MINRPRRLRIGAAALTAGLLLAACGTNGDSDSSSAADTATSTAGPTTSAHDDQAEGTTLTAADLRTTLNGVLQEHVFLTGAAVNEAFQGNTAGFDAAVAALDENSSALSEAVGLAYGPEAEEEFLGLWRAHIDLFVAYATALGEGDQAAADEQAEFLAGYATDFANYLAVPTGIDAAALEALVLEHIATLTEVIDVMATGDPTASFTALREAMGHMHMIADPLAVAIADGDPDAFPGDPESNEATVQTALDLLLREHVMLAGAAVNEALRANAPAFEAAAAALDANSVDLAAAVGDALGTDTGDEFLALWRSHIDLFVAYTTALATDDQASADEQAQFLTDYATDLANFLSEPTGIDAADLEAVLLEHILTLKAAIDTIAEGQANPFVVLQEAAAHMGMIAQPLAVAITGS